VSSVTRGTTHLIAVVMGGRTAIRRDLEMVRLLDQSFMQIAANPTMVARASVPWQQTAQNIPAPGLAGLSLPQVSAGFSMAQGSPNAFAASSTVPATVQSDDEDAAEAVRAPDENFALIHAEGALVRPPASTTPPAAPQPAVPIAKAETPAVRPVARSSGGVEQAVKIASNAPVAKPQMRPVQRDDSGEGDLDGPAVSPGRNWTIQIGAYADKGLALARLKTYAGKAQDVLARASKIIAPMQSAHGHMIYRARFGLFAEQEARDVCSRLTQRGQSCIAAVQTR